MLIFIFLRAFFGSNYFSKENVLKMENEKYLQNWTAHINIAGAIHKLRYAIKVGGWLMKCI